ncbi:MAG TPA: DUF2630 family protein [Acidimicrobiales bacterium]
MNDGTILSHIEKLSVEEQELEESHHGTPLAKDQLARLKAVEVELDQAYDLLRQRRARRSAGQNPDLASVRKEDVVENYLQ